MPHQALIRDDHATSKVPVVYDASSTIYGPSLNECLESGESRFLDLFRVLIRFRCYKFVLVADIEKAFLKIRIAESDRDALRLLWVEDPFDGASRTKVLRFTRVCFGLVSSMCEATIGHHLTNYKDMDSSISKEVIAKIRSSLYADDLSTGANNLEDAKMLYRNAKDVFRQAAMNLRK